MSGIIAQNSGRHTGLIKAASAGGEWTLIETITASSDATISFTSGLDSTYDEYCFIFLDIHPETNDTEFSFQGSTDGGSSYGVTLTSNGFDGYRNEAGTVAAFAYASDQDLAQSTSFQIFQQDYGNDADQNAAGYLELYNPSSTTFIKHWMSQSSNAHHADYAIDVTRAGYFNTTSAIDAIQFKFNSGAIDAGTISLYGIG